MKQQKVRGKVKKVQGKVKETVGILAGNKKVEHDGRPTQACQKCSSAAANMRSLCDKCFAAGVASVHAEV